MIVDRSNVNIFSILVKYDRINCDAEQNFILKKILNNFLYLILKQIIDIHNYLTLTDLNTFLSNVPNIFYYQLI